MRQTRCASLSVLICLFSSALAHADDAPPPVAPPTTPPAAPDPPPAPPPEPPAELSPEELKKLEEALGQDAGARKDGAGKVPDLSQVNVGAALPMAQSLNPDIAVVANLAAATFGELALFGAPPSGGPLQLGGHDPSHTGFTLQNLELSIGAAVDPFLRFDTNLVFGEEVEVEEAYATTLALPWNLQARAGMFLTKLGRLNETHPHSWQMLDQPLANGVFLGEDGNRGLGGEVSWLSPLPWSLVVVMSAQEALGECCSATYTPGDPIEVKDAGDLVYTGVVEQFFPFTDDLSLLWGLSAQAGPAHDLDDEPYQAWSFREGRAELFATDLFLRYRPVVSETRWYVDVQTEAYLRARHGDGYNPVDGGGYAQVAWHIDANWFTAARYDLVLPVDEPVHTDLGAVVQRGALMFGYAPTHFSRLRVQGTVGSRGNGDVVYGAMVGMEIAIGAHGAHAY